MKKTLIFAFAFWFVAAPVTALDAVPYFNARILGGQYFFEGQEGSLSGNFNVDGGASIQWDDRTTLMPTYMGSYRGTKSVTDLVGGGTLFQERMNHRFALAAAYEMSEKWVLRPETGLALEFLNETKNESWGSGLFDYRRPFFSLTAEHREKRPFKTYFGFDYYRIHFQNYTALEASAPGTVSRELAGTSTLDTHNYGLRVGTSFPMPWESAMETRWSMTRRVYPDQNIVLNSGLLDPQTRRDTLTGLDVSWRFPRRWGAKARVLSAFHANLGHTESNQNSFDAQRTQFLEDYYDNTKVGIGMSAFLSREIDDDRAFDVSASLRYRHTAYKDRLTQDTAGSYLSDQIHLNEYVFALSGSYPMAPGFRWTSTLQFGKQTSNMQFEKLYTYNYNTVSYLIGFSYEY